MNEINRTGNMRYRTLGKTGIVVSEVSFGSHLDKVNVDNPQQRRKQIEMGIEKGINLFDIYEHSYKQYGPMSEALDCIRDEAVISLVTVWRAIDEVMDEVEYALRAFKRDYIDLFRVVLSDDWNNSEQRLHALMKAKEQGKIRAIGGVVHHPEHLLEGLRRYSDVIEYIMAPACFYTPLLIREDGDLFPAVKKNHIGVIAMKPMGAADQEGGYIFKLKPKGRPFEELQQKGLSIGKLAIKYLLQSDVISSVLPTMNSVEEVLENVRASGDGPLTGEEARFLQEYREEADRTFSKILPENDYWITPWKA